MNLFFKHWQWAKGMKEEIFCDLLKEKKMKPFIGYPFPEMADGLFGIAIGDEAKRYIDPVCFAEDLGCGFKSSFVGAGLMVPVDHAADLFGPLGLTGAGEVLLCLCDGGSEVIDGVIGPDTDIMEDGSDGVFLMVVVIAVDDQAIEIDALYMVAVLLMVLANDGTEGLEEGE